MQYSLYPKLRCEQCASKNRSESNKKGPFSWCAICLVLYEN